MSSPTLEAFDQIAHKQDDLAAERIRLLEKRGWKYTCNTPGSIWLMEKKLPDGRLLLVNVSTAEDVERSLCYEDEG